MSKARCLFSEPFRASVTLGWNGGCYAALTSYRPQLLIQDDSSPCQFCWSVVDQGTASLWRRFLRWFLCPSRASSQYVHVDRYCHFRAFRSTTESLTPSREQFWCPAILSGGQFVLFIGVFSILHVSCAFSFYHRPLKVVLAKNP